MKKNLSALALFLTLSAYCSPCSSLADDVAPDNAGKGGSVPESGRAALLEEAKSRLLSRGGKLLNSARGEFLRLVGLDGAVPGTLAEVNGQPISLRQVEALYDMRTAGSENAQAISWTNCVPSMLPASRRLWLKFSSMRNCCGAA